MDGRKKLTQQICCCCFAVETIEIHQFQPNKLFSIWNIQKRSSNNKDYVRSHRYFSVYFIVHSSHTIRQNVDIMCSTAHVLLIRWHTADAAAAPAYIWCIIFFRSSANTYLHLTYLYLVYFSFSNLSTFFAVVPSSIQRSASSLGWNSNKRPFRYIETCGDFPKYRSRISMWISATLATGCILTWWLYLQKR